MIHFDTTAPTPEQFTQLMNQIVQENGRDFEGAKVDADNLVCELLKSLGYGESAEIFSGIPVF